jgi:hypothetical protein
MGAPRLPLSYFQGALAVPRGWDERPGAYLAFGDTYTAERDDAAQRGWPMRTLPAGHLHQLTIPAKSPTRSSHCSARSASPRLTDTQAGPSSHLAPLEDR